MSSNNDNNQYDPSRLIFAPSSVKKEPTSSSTSNRSVGRISSIRPTNQIGPPTSSNTMIDASSTRRFMPKVGSQSNRRRIVSSGMSSDINEPYDLLSSSLDGSSMNSRHGANSSGFGGNRNGPQGNRGGSGDSRGGNRNFDPNSGRNRRLLDNIIHMNPSNSFAEHKIKEDPMVIDSSDEDEEKVLKSEPSPKQLYKDYFQGVNNPPLILTEDDHLETNDSLFDGHASLKEDELFFIQFPSHLPMNIPEKRVNKKQQSVDDEYEDTWNKEFENSLISIPEGQLGVLKVYKSGKTKLELKTLEGQSILLDVLPSQDHSFCEDVKAIDIDGKNCFMLGSISKRITCIPDCETLLSVSTNSDAEE